MDARWPSQHRPETDDCSPTIDGWPERSLWAWQRRWRLGSPETRPGSSRSHLAFCGSFLRRSHGGSAFHPQPVAKRLPTSEDVQALRLVARRTWRFFETFVTTEDHMLPPDNFQEDPSPVMAHRTSPTNLGLYLLSTASAHDFGWLGIIDTIERLEATLSTMGTLARFRGHFYNWYDTADLRPLDPQYISTVDSGNLAGHLIALANACDSWNESSLGADKRLKGIGDALDLVRAEVESLRDRQHTETVTWRQFDEAFALAFLRCALLASSRRRSSNASRI